MESFSLYDFEIHKEDEGWVYDIYSREYKNILVESDEWFDTEQEARYAAIGHISLLENGEG